MNSIKTTCPYCGVGCGVLADTVANRDVAIRGDETHPANSGRLCSKGMALAETLDNSNRLLYPEINGQRSGWAAALDTIAWQFTSTIARHGPDAVAFYVSGQLLTEDYYVANKLMKGYVGSANIDTNSRLCMASSVAGHRRAFGSDTVPGVYEDLELADLVVLVGSNLAWCHPVLHHRLLKAKEKRPAMQLVVIDPRRTATAEVADLHLAIQPDSDVALFNGLLSHLIAGGVIDTDYIARHTRGFEQTARQVANLDLADVAAITGLSRQDLSAFYAAFAGNRKVVTLYSQGVNQSNHGTDKVNAIINCHLATGRIGLPGCGPFSITGQPNAMGGREVGGLANMLACHMDIENAQHRSIVQRFWRSPRIARKPGLKAVELFQAVEQGRIKALWIMATNPADTLPDANRVTAALARCPFVVVSDVVNQNDTLRHATVRLPAQAWGEKDGTVTNSERCISRQRRFRVPAGEARPDWWALAQVARRMGYTESFSYTGPAAIFREYAALSACENGGTRDFDIGACATLPDAAYINLRPFQWPRPQADSGKCAQSLRFFGSGGFFHSDRKARLVPVRADTRRRVSARHPFCLNTGRIRDQWHTMTRTGFSSRLSAHIGEPFVDIHPECAQSLGIKDAELVKIANDYGKIVTRARISESQQAGHVFVPMHWNDQFASAAKVDSLVPSLVDPVSGQPALKNVAVSVKAFSVDWYGFAVVRNKPSQIETDYWAISRCEPGWRIEFATRQQSAIAKLCVRLLGSQDNTQILDYTDVSRSQRRYAAFDAGGRLHACVYLAGEPVAVSRSWVTKQFSQTFNAPGQRQALIAGRPGAGMPDPGPIVCSCFAVGRNQLYGAVQRGCSTLESIGEQLSAGTNCGSCRGEIQQLLATEVH